VTGGELAAEEGNGPGVLVVEPRQIRCRMRHNPR
jgi:hypothetical protein